MYNIPNVADVVQSWSIPMTAHKIEEDIVDFEVVEKRKRINFKGVPPQPITPQELQLKPEGQRDWKYYTIYSTYKFKIDDLIEIDKIRYRIKQVQAWRNIYGYWKFEMIEDYEDKDEQDKDNL